MFSESKRGKKGLPSRTISIILVRKILQVAQFVGAALNVFVRKNIYTTDGMVTIALEKTEDESSRCKNCYG